MLEQGSDLVNRKIISDAQKIESADIKNSESRKAALQQELINLKQNTRIKLFSTGIANCHFGR